MVGPLKGVFFITTLFDVFSTARSSHNSTFSWDASIAPWMIIRTGLVGNSVPCKEACAVQEFVEENVDIQKVLAAD